VAAVPRPRQDAGRDHGDHPPRPLRLRQPGELGVRPRVGGVAARHVEGADGAGLQTGGRRDRDLFPKRRQKHRRAKGKAAPRNIMLP